MNSETRKALRGAIEKWERIVAGTGKDEAWRNCPLCELFIEDVCVGCPVYANTGLAGCRGTPYPAFVAHESRENAQAELDFLRSLDPEKCHGN